MVKVTLTLKVNEEMALPEDMAQPLAVLGRAGLLNAKGLSLTFEVETTEDAEIIEMQLDELLSDRPYSVEAKIKTVNERTAARRQLRLGPSPMDKAGWEK